jgi:hypothetical protein
MVSFIFLNTAFYIVFFYIVLPFKRINWTLVLGKKDCASNKERVP